MPQMAPNERLSKLFCSLLINFVATTTASNQEERAILHAHQVSLQLAALCLQQAELLPLLDLIVS